MEPVAFTTTYTKPATCITTTCKVSLPYDQTYDNGEHPEYVECEAIWDTGAMRSTISVALAEQLALSPLGQTVVYHADGESICNYHLINLLLPNKVEIAMLTVNSGQMKDADLLIGMDVITMCDFALTSPKGDTKFSFQIPSREDIDFNI